MKKRRDPLSGGGLDYTRPYKEFETYSSKKEIAENCIVIEGIDRRKKYLRAVLARKCAAVLKEFGIT